MTSSSYDQSVHADRHRLLPCPVPWRVDLLHCPLAAPAMLYHALSMTSSSLYRRPPCACALCCMYSRAYFTPPTRTRQVRVGSVNRIGDRSRLSATENFEIVLSSLEMRCEQSFVLSLLQYATRTCLQTRSHCRQDWTKLFSLQYIEDY